MVNMPDNKGERPMNPVIEKINAKDGTPIITARFVPDKPRGAVLMVHGFGEHHAGYHALGQFFCENGYAAVAYDQRGHGEGHKNSWGVFTGYDLLLDDVAAMRGQIEKWFPGLPVTLYGHSMGGNVAVNYILKRGAGGFVKLIMETPWLRLFKPPLPKPLLFLGKLIGRISHKPAAVSKLDPEAVTRNKPVNDEQAADGLYHNRLSFRIFSQITEAGEYAIANAARLTLPTLVFCAEADKIVSPDAIKEFAKSARDNVKLHIEAEGYHALHNDIEPTRSAVLNRMLDFLDSGFAK
jgi:alpha-beta hydrolase superfamily lysophospholipase